MAHKRSSPLRVLRFSSLHRSAAWLVMNEINSETHSWMHSLDSFESLACCGKAFFITRATVCVSISYAAWCVDIVPRPYRSQWARTCLALLFRSRCSVGERPSHSYPSSLVVFDCWASFRENHIHHRLYRCTRCSIYLRARFSQYFCLAVSIAYPA